VWGALRFLDDKRSALFGADLLLWGGLRRIGPACARNLDLSQRFTPDACANPFACSAGIVLVGGGGEKAASLALIAVE